MAKIIEEEDNRDIDKQIYWLVARNDSKHVWFKFTRHGDKAATPLTTEGMRKLAAFLVEFADKIDADSDFKK